MNCRAVREKEVVATIRGEIRRAAESAGSALEALQQLSALGLASTSELFPGASSEELRVLACQLSALAARSAQSFAEIAHAAGRLETLAALREATKE